MKKKSVFIALTSAISLMSCTSSAESIQMEKCYATKNGKNIIKEYQADCATSTRSCSGQNPENDPESWIIVPKGQCDKINAGDYKDISQNIKDKLNIDDN